MNLRLWHALACGLVIVFTLGCQPKTEQPVAQAPQEQPVAEPFPEAQVPPPEPQPAPQPAVKVHEIPPVDTEAAPAKASSARKAQPKESYAPPAKKAARTHVVKQGETLQKISQKYYGTTTKWRQIYNANKKALPKGPDQVVPGTKLVIP